MDDISFSRSIYANQEDLDKAKRKYLIKTLLDYVDSTNKAMCTDDRKNLRKKVEAKLVRHTCGIKE